MKESYSFSDLPRSADPLNAGAEVIDNPANHHSIFGLAGQLNELLPGTTPFAQDTASIADASVAINAVHWRLLDYDPNDVVGKNYLTQDTYEAMGLPTASLCKALEFSTLGAESLNNLVNALYREQTMPDESNLIMDWLRERQYAPDEARVLMQDLRDEILVRVGEITENLADMLLALLDANYGGEVDERAAKIIEQDTSKSASVEQLQLTIRHERFGGVPHVDLGGAPAATLLRSVIASYRRRLRILGNMPPHELPDRENPSDADIAQSTLLMSRPQESREVTQYIDPAAQQITNLQDGIADLIRLHRERTRPYREGPSWVSSRDFLAFSEFIDRQRLLELRNENHPHMTRQRVIGLMAALSEIGSRDPEPNEIIKLDLQQRLTELFTFERAVDINLRRGAAALKAANVTSDLVGWNSVELDVALLKKHWRNLLPTVREHWPQDDGQGAVTAITNVLNAFNVYREEIADPENRLRTVATHLGATVLRPDRYSKRTTLGPDQRQYAISDLLESIATDEQLQENTRYRAEVIKHFINGTASSHQDQPAELFYIPPTKEQTVPYFCVNFRSPESVGWILIESLRYGKASYVFPQELIEREGRDVSLADFLNRHSKAKLVRRGGIQVIHSDGWTPNSHLLAIREKITKRQ